MPTGYTAPVADGQITSLKEFAMRCARAFGATIDMRDDDLSKPIPDEFIPQSDYHRLSAQKAADRLRFLERLSPLEAQREMQQAYSAAMACWRDATIRDAQLRARYLSMIDQVEAWSPPTPDHDELRSFMLEQLRSSLAQCGGEYIRMPRMKRWSEWLAEQRERATSRLAREEKSIREEYRLAFDRTQWVRVLRASLELELEPVPAVMLLHWPRSNS